MNAFNQRDAEPAVQATPPDSSVIDSYRGWALEETHPVQRALQYSASNLLGLATRLHRELEGALAGSGRAIDTFNELAPEFELMLRLARQSERFINTAAKFAPPAARGSAPPPAPEIKTGRQTDA
jgi:hypothetical protein